MALISKECPTKIFSSFVMDWNIERNTFCCISKLDTKNTNFELKTAVLIVQCLLNETYIMPKIVSKTSTKEQGTSLFRDN